MKPLSALHRPSARPAGRRRAVSLPALLALCAMALPALAQPNFAETARAPEGVADPAKAAAVVEMARFLPLRPGNRWSFVGDYGTEETLTAGNRVSLSGVSVVPLTTTLQGVPAGTLYLTNDRNGLQRYREYIDTIYIDGYGAVSASATFSPPILHAPAFATVGSTYTSSGAVTFVYTGLATVDLSQESSTHLAGFETVTDAGGTQSWVALKMVGTVRVFGTVYGQYLSTTGTTTHWLAEGLGIVKSQTADEMGAVVTWYLTSASVALATVPGAPTAVSAVAGDARATVGFAAPADDGGAPVTLYTATSEPGGRTGTCSAPCASITVTGLAIGVAHTFSVTATNAMGTGAASAPSNPIVPFASNPGEPVGSLGLPAKGDCVTDFYIAEAALADGAKPGYWGMEVQLSAAPRELRGGFNLGGGFDAGGLNPGFGAFSLSFTQRVTLTIAAQPLAGPIELVVDLLKDNVQRLSGVQGTPAPAAPLSFAADLAPGFYVVRIGSTPTSGRGTFQLQLYTPGSFAGGVVVGGYLDRDTAGRSLTGFGAFCVPQSQPVRVSLFGPSLYGANAAGDLVLTLRDYQRSVLGVYR